MHTPSEGEYVEPDTSLAEAIHKLINGRHQQLMVIKEKSAVGILNLSGVIKLVSRYNKLQ